VCRSNRRQKIRGPISTGAAPLKRTPTGSPNKKKSGPVAFHLHTRGGKKLYNETGSNPEQGGHKTLNKLKIQSRMDGQRGGGGGGTEEKHMAAVPTQKKNCSGAGAGIGKYSHIARTKKRKRQMPKTQSAPQDCKDAGKQLWQGAKNKKSSTQKNDSMATLGSKKGENPKALSQITHN